MAASAGLKDILEMVVLKVYVMIIMYTILDKIMKLNKKMIFLWKVLVLTFFSFLAQLSKLSHWVTSP